MKTVRKTPLKPLALLAALAMALTGASASAEDKEKNDPKPEEVQPEKKKAGKTKAAKAPEKKTQAPAKVEVRVRSADAKKDGKQSETEKRQSLQIIRSPHATGHEKGHDQEVKPRTWLGIAMRAVPDSLREYLELPDGFGVQVEHVAAKSPADEAGLQPHDILTHLDDQRIISPEHVAILVRSMKKGAKVEMTYIRKGKEQNTTVTLGERDLPPFSNAPATNYKPLPYPPNRQGHDGQFRFNFGEPGKDGGHFEFHLPDGKGNEEIQKLMRNYGNLLKDWFEKNPDAMPNRWNFNQPGPSKPAPPGAELKPDPGKQGQAKPKPIPPLPGKSDGKPPAISVSPGFPLQVFGGAGVVKIDNAKGAVTIIGEDGKHKITIKNNDGETVYEGPYDSKTGTKGLPKEAREQLEAMKLNDLKLIMPARPKSDSPPRPKTPPTKKGEKDALL